MSVGRQAVQTESAGCAGIDLRLKVGKWCQQVWTPQSGTAQICHYLRINCAKVNGVYDFGNVTFLLPTFLLESLRVSPAFEYHQHTKQCI